MEYFFSGVALTIIFLGVLNLLRISVFLIGSDIYSLKKHLRKRRNIYFPFVSVIIPAFNEEASILTSVKSVLSSDYPKDKFEVIVINDGSTDKTEDVLREFLKVYSPKNLIISSQANTGKAHALNNGIKNYSFGELVMCLDADSYINKDAIKNAVYYFENPKVMALASNVKIAPGKGILNVIQKYEYIISHQLKRALTIYNIEYIIGGVGSLFRKSFLEKINFYDEDTVTEDIDLTMKILRSGNKKVRVVYAADVISYTQSVLSIKDLIRQRYRWKWGRFQTFLKNKNMFFTTDENFTGGFTWFYLPYVLFSEITLLLEPILFSFIITLTIIYSDLATLVGAICFVSFYMIMNIISEETISIKERLKMLPLVPLMYVLFYVLSFVEYCALIKSLINMPNLKKSLFLNKTSWNPVKRIGFAR